MRIPPLQVIFSWPAPNYTNPVTRSKALIVVNSLFIAFTLLAVYLRIYSRVKIKKWYGVDDTMIILATIFAAVLYVVVLLGNLRFNWDRHIWDVHPRLIQGANIIAFCAKLAFVSSSTFTRVSLCCFYYRLVQDSGLRWFNWAIHVAMAYLWAIFITFTLLVIFVCLPVQAYWIYPPMQNCKCLNEGTIVLIAGVLNCLSDFLVATLPIPIVARLQMPLRNRVGVTVLLTLGYVVTIAGIVRTYFIYYSLVASYDETWYAYPLWIAATVEIDLAVVSQLYGPDHDDHTDRTPDMRLRSSDSYPSESKTPKYHSEPLRDTSLATSSKWSSALSSFHGLPSLHLTTRTNNETQTGGVERPLTSSKFYRDLTSLAFGDSAKTQEEEDQCHTGAMKDGYDTVDVIDPGPVRPPFQITKTQTLDQASSYESQDEPQLRKSDIDWLQGVS